jgi:hypothetical protein
MKLSGWARLWIVASAVWWVIGALWLIVNFGPVVEIETGMDASGGPFRKVHEDWTKWLASLVVVVTAPFLAAPLFAYGFGAFKKFYNPKSPDSTGKNSN